MEAQLSLDRRACKRQNWSWIKIWLTPKYSPVFEVSELPQKEDIEKTQLEKTANPTYNVQTDNKLPVDGVNESYHFKPPPTQNSQ